MRARAFRRRRPENDISEPDCCGQVMKRHWDGVSWTVTYYAHSVTDSYVATRCGLRRLKKRSTRLRYRQRKPLKAGTFHWLDVGASATCRHLVPERIGVVGAIGQEDIARPQAFQQTLGTASILRLAGRELERDGQAICSTTAWILVVRPAARATHATGSVFFWGVSDMLVNPNRRTVDHLDIAIASSAPSRLPASIAGSPKVRYLYVAIDRCSRYVHVAIYGVESAENVRQGSHDPAGVASEA